jgi:hypothetical protein
MAKAFDFKKFGKEMLGFTAAAKEKVGPLRPCLDSAHREEIILMGGSGQIYRAGAPSVSAGEGK